MSRAFPGRLYHHNDSGAGPLFYLTDRAGGSVRTVALPIPQPTDTEDMALGRCAGAHSCLYLGDIGDNPSLRTGISFNVVAERRDYGAQESPLRIVKARYPDGAHNAEAFAIHPNGDLFLVTKAASPAPTQIFRLTRQQLAVSDGSVQTFTEVGRFDLLALMQADGPKEAFRNGAILVTGMDISPDGRRFLILTYDGAVELGFNLARPIPPQSQWRAGRDFRVIDTTRLPQAEAIAYEPGGRAFLYDSESPGNPPDSPILRQRCEVRR